MRSSMVSRRRVDVARSSPAGPPLAGRLQLVRLHLQLVQLRLATLYSLYTMVQLLSSDNETFTVDKQVAERSILIKNMLEGES